MNQNWTAMQAALDDARMYLIPGCVFAHPEDVMLAKLMKTTDGTYLADIDDRGIPRIKGTPIYPDKSTPEGEPHAVFPEDRP